MRPSLWFALMGTVTGLYLFVNSGRALMDGGGGWDLLYWCIGCGSLFVAALTIGRMAFDSGLSGTASAFIPVLAGIGIVGGGLYIKEVRDPTPDLVSVPPAFQERASNRQGVSILVDNQTGCEWFVTEQGGQGGSGPSSLVPRTERLADGTDRQVCNSPVQKDE